jgi:TRAP-type C4-dicarboxylate transport system permease large subunit
MAGSYFPAGRALLRNELIELALVVVDLGLFAPPFGVGYYAGCVIGKIEPDAEMRKIRPYMGVLVVGLVAVAAIPWLSARFLRH